MRASSLDCVLFCCEDSLRYLVQDSLVSFTQMILDAAHSTLELPEDFQWQDNYIVSAFRCVLRQRTVVVRVGWINMGKVGQQ